MAEFDIFNLQVEEPKVSINDYSWTFYGQAGIGKSSVAGLLFDDPAFFKWEDNQKHIKAKKIGVSDWKQMKVHAKNLRKGFDEGRDMPFVNGIMDTVDFAWKKCTEYVCKNKGWEHPSDGEWGKGWEAVADEFMSVMADLEYIGIKPVYISHDKDKEFKPKKGEKFNKIIPNTPAGCMATIVDRVNMVLYFYYEKEVDEDGKEVTKRYIAFRDNGDFIAKSHLLYMPDRIEMGDTPEETVKRIKEAFNNAVEKEFGVKAAEPAPKKEEKKVEKRAEKKANKKKDEKPVEPTVEEKEPGAEETSLDDIKLEIESKLKADLKSKKRSAVEIVSLVEEYTGVKKIADITDVEKAMVLLKAVA